MSKKNKAPSVIVAETFRQIGEWELGRLTQSHPSVFNGQVSVERYRITVERIEERPAVIHERLQRLWEESNNHHEWHPLKAAAAAHGYELRGDQGARHKKRESTK